MVLIGVGEAFKKIDRRLNFSLSERYPGIEWRGVMGIRDVIAHGYFDIDVEEVFSVCQSDIPVLLETIHRMIEGLRNDPLLPKQEL